MKIRSGTRSAMVMALPLAVLAAATTGASAQGLGVAAGAMSAAAPQSAVEQVRRRNTGRNFAIGLGILGTAIILNEAARADGRRRYSRDSYCGRLLYRCESGSDLSCEKYEDRCM